MRLIAFKMCVLFNSGSVKTHKLQSKTHEKKFKTHLVLKHTTREKTIFGAKKCLKHTGFSDKILCVFLQNFVCFLVQIA